MRITHIVVGRKSTESFSPAVYKQITYFQCLGCETHIKTKVEPVKRFRLTEKST